MSLLLMLALLFVPQGFIPQGTTPAKCTLSGTVVNAVSGEPLSKTEVVAELTEQRDPPTVASTTTDAKGNFTLIDLDPGTYRLTAHRRGYLDSSYGSRMARERGTPLTLEAGQELKDLRIKAVPFGVIAGTIRDTDGEPLANVSVEIFKWTYEGGRRNISGIGGTSTDDLGQYRLIGLTPGRYYVRTQDLNHDGRSVDHSPKSAHPPEFPIPTFYPGTTNAVAASPVDVAPGARVTGIDISLFRSRVFRVTVQIEAPAGLDVDARLTYQIPGFGNIGQTIKSKRAIDIRGVPPGSWMLTAYAGDPDPTPGTMSFDFSKRTYEARIPVQVSGADLEGVRVGLSAGADVRGHITVEGEKPPSLVGSGVSFDDGDPDGNTSNISPENTFVNRLSSGHYVVDLSGITQGNLLFVKSMQSDGRDILRDGLVVSGVARIALEIVLSPDGGQIEGVAVDKDGKPAPGATVVLVPGRALQQRHDFFKEFTADQQGHFQFKGIAPGDYKLLAWEDIEAGSWLDPAFLKDFEAKGEPVTVEAKGHHTAQVQVIPVAN